MPLNRYDLARLGLTLAALTALLATAATAAPPAPAAPAGTPVSVWLPEWIGPAPVADVADYSAIYGATSVPTAPGMIVAIDAETGLPIRPSAAQRRMLALAMSAESSDLLAPSDAPLLIERLPGGGEIRTLNGHYQMFSIARIAADGRIVTDCAPDVATAKRMLTATSKPRVRAEKE